MGSHPDRKTGERFPAGGGEGEKTRERRRRRRRRTQEFLQKDRILLLGDYETEGGRQRHQRKYSATSGERRVKEKGGGGLDALHVTRGDSKKFTVPVCKNNWNRGSVTESENMKRCTCEGQVLE
ncbi:hypothetical protein RUM43_000239 [Polyplax serrata]|uniref:Uncharacterized protein n=1 Tax=Polyplax serrata TaxID=468196 RepID=A0AAN8XN79_POLSC